MFRVNVAGVIREPLTSRYIMMLETAEDSGTDIMIPVGKFEAQNISSRKCPSGKCAKSPYDILTPVLNASGSLEFNKLVIDDCCCGIFTAKLYLKLNSREIVMDCRPSDGVVLALDRSIPIYVAKVLTCP